MLKLPIKYIKELLNILDNKELHLYEPISDLLYLYVFKGTPFCYVLIDVLSLLILGHFSLPPKKEVVNIETHIRYGARCTYNTGSDFISLNNFRWYNPRPNCCKKSVMLHQYYDINKYKELISYRNYIDNLIDCYIFEGVLSNTDAVNPSPVMKEWGFDTYIISVQERLNKVIDELESNYPIEVINR